MSTTQWFADGSLSDCAISSASRIDEDDSQRERADDGSDAELFAVPENGRSQWVEGCVDSLTAWGATGWAWVPSAPDEALGIEAVLDDRIIGRDVADHMRFDLVALGKRSGFCSFSVAFEEAIDGGGVPLLRAVGSGGVTELFGSHLSNVTGYIDMVTSVGATGWVWMPAEPDRALRVEAVLDGEVIGHTMADLMRPDIASSGRGSGKYGFRMEFEAPLSGAKMPELRALGPGPPTVLMSPSALSLGALPAIPVLFTPSTQPLAAAEYAGQSLDGIGQRSDRMAMSVDPLFGSTHVTEDAVEAYTDARHDGHVFAIADADIAKKLFEIHLIGQSSLFDDQYYLAQNSDIAAAGTPALEHFYEFGYLEGRKPNFYFDPTYYLNANPDVQQARIHPLVHYISAGDREGRKPSLCFDPSWYRKQNNVPDADNALLHYLQHCKSSRFSPVQEFDIEFYARSYPDVVAAGIDPFEHFVTYGYLEGRIPSVEFNANYYRARYLGGELGVNPFLHYLAHKHEPGVFGRLLDDEATIPREVKRFTRPAAEFEEFTPLPSSAPRRAKVLAYYLPQFHAFPENDAWWGKGFTEWTNVPRGLPRFKGHYQPRLPRDLGFYSLDHTETIRRQAALAQAGGVFGFVFYYYWFNGKRLLEKPTEAFLGDGSIEMPFCLMWANENWTRRWDGADTEVLISQDYRLDDEADLIADLARHFKDPRYIRIQGRPLLMIYRVGLIEESKKTIARWRKLFKEKLGEDPLLVMGQAFLASDPGTFGMDGAIEFPPHKLTQGMPSINQSLQYLDLEFEGKVYRYDDVVDISLNEPTPAFPLIKTAVPSWDNDARRQGNGLVLTDSTPQKYQAWLSELIDRAVDNPFFGESIVCVNAWNEWCEGAYLEPDLHYGAAYLNATGRAAVGRSVSTDDGRVLLVGHDCFPGGAQHLLLTIGRTLKSHFGVETSVVLLDGGALEGAYREIGPVKIGGIGPALDAHLATLRNSGYTAAIVNTSAAGAAVPALKKAGIDVTLLVHELPRILREKDLVATARTAARLADRLVFPAPFVRDEFLAAVAADSDAAMLIAPQGMYQNIAVSQRLRDERRLEFGVDPDQRLVIGMGYADMRKGFDLFLQAWRLVRSTSSLVVHFCWVGNIDPALENMMRDEIRDAELTTTFHMPGFRRDVSSFFAAADAFVLSSREDPFPSVVLEALYATLPVIAFERAGGIPDVLRDHPLGHVVPFADTIALADRVLAAVREGPDREARAAGKAIIERKFDFTTYVWQLLLLAHRDLSSISVVVPNYNYARHMAKRLGSIFLQTYPVKEIVVLDDCSTDDSLSVIPAVAKEWGRHITLLPNRTNSGSVFKQWRKAAKAATGDYLWIAEADDLCAPQFLSTLVNLLRQHPDVRFAFSDSSAIDAEGESLWPSYKSYYATVQPHALMQTQVFEADDFVKRFLSVKNLILNVSAVVWRRDALLEAMDECEAELKTYRMGGDWRLYLQALSGPGAQVGYCAEPLNTHRRHSTSVTHALDAKSHVREIAACHAFAKSAFKLQSTTVGAQTLYRREISRQLRVKETARAH